MVCDDQPQREWISPRLKMVFGNATLCIVYIVRLSNATIMKQVVLVEPDANMMPPWVYVSSGVEPETAVWEVKSIFPSLSAEYFSMEPLLHAPLWIRFDNKGLRPVSKIS